jgi:hypothetical protein
MRKKQLTFLTLLLSAALTVQAQTDKEGRKVKRITFDQEQVKIEYVDGTSRTDVKEMTVNGDKSSSGICVVTPAKGNAQRSWYTTYGRTMQGEPRQKGVYIVREQTGVKKTIKK